MRLWDEYVLEIELNIRYQKDKNSCIGVVEWKSGWFFSPSLYPYVS